MTPIAIDPARVEKTTNFGTASAGRPDRLRQVVHVALALYLTPVVAIVCVIGGISIVVGKATRAAERHAIKRSQARITTTCNDQR
jgi:hypothetical protein